MFGPLSTRAMSFAIEAHGNQRDRQGVRFVTHPIRVACAVAEIPGVPDWVVAAALLHDVLEDTPAKLEDGLFPLVTVDLVKVLTHGKDETYEAYIDRVCKADKWAIHIKLRDIADNSLPWRNKGGKPPVKYEQAVVKLLAALEGPCLTIPASV